MTTQDILENSTALLGREPTEPEKELLNDFRSENGIARKLWKKIGIVNIDHPVIKKTFCDFIEKSGGISSFRLIDLLSFNESVRKGGFAYGNVGDYILCFSSTPRDKKLSKQVFKNSVNGLYELIDRTNGFAIDLAAFSGEDIHAFDGKRFVFADHKKALNYKKQAEALGITVYMLGMVTSDKRIVILKNGLTEAELDKSILIPDDNELYTADIRDIFMPDYKSGFLSVLYYKYGISASQYFPIKLGAGGSISRVLAVLLGMYSASKSISLTAVKLLLSDTSDIDIPIGKVNVNEGDRIYLLKPTCNTESIPVIDSYKRLNAYLLNLKTRYPMMAVSPVDKNLESAISRLIDNDVFTFQPVPQFDSREQAVSSVIVVCPADIDGKMLGYVRRKQIIKPAEMNNNNEIL